MKKLCLLMLLNLLVAGTGHGSYGLTPEWRQIKEQVTADFAAQVELELAQIQTKLEADLGLSLETLGATHGRFSSWQGADATISQCLPALNCGQYECMQQQYQCAPTSFLPNFPVRVCKGFEDDINRGRYDEEGVLWVYQTTYCLQKMALKGLIDPARSDTARCEVIEEQIVDRHEECFFEQQKSLCDLSFQNKKAVFLTLIPHGKRFVTKNNRLDWHRVKILWDHFSRCPLRDIFKEDGQCEPIAPQSCEGEECLQRFADSLQCFLK